MRTLPTRSSSRRRLARFKKDYTHRVLPVLYKEQLSESWDMVHDWLLVQDSLEQAAMTILQAQGVPQDQWQYYLTYVRRKWKVEYNFTGATRTDELTSLLNEFVLRGLDPAVLGLL